MGSTVDGPGPIGVGCDGLDRLCDRRRGRQVYDFEVEERIDGAEAPTPAVAVAPQKALSRGSSALLGVAVVASLTAVAVAIVSLVSINSLRDDIAATSSRLDAAQKDGVSLGAQVDNLFTQVGELSKDAQGAAAAAAAAKFDPAQLAKAALPSVVTVFCGDSLGSGFSYADVQPAPGWDTVIITNHHVIKACTFVPGPVLPSVAVASPTRPSSGHGMSRQISRSSW